MYPWGMGFKIGTVYSRDEICSELGVPPDQHAVITNAAGAAIALVISRSGRHPSGKQYANQLTKTALLMQGEYDSRGSALMSSSNLPLFISSESSGYRHEGLIKFVKRTDYDGDVVYEFARQAGTSTT